MYFSHIKLINWRNFHEAEADLSPVTYVIGPNASGKSNMLDAIRFLRDVAMDGVQKAVQERGEFKHIRCLHARNNPTDLGIEVILSSDPEGKIPKWKYILHLNKEKNGKHRILIEKELVIEIINGEENEILTRPNDKDQKDSELKTQTALEQISANSEFREIADFFKSISYLHLVPQLLKYADVIGGNRVAHDPFGQGFLERIAQTTERTREKKLGQIAGFINQITNGAYDRIAFKRDDITGRPHLELNFVHHRKNGAKHRETDLSDGTLRLIALFWQLLETKGVWLLEEPELSLNEAIVEKLALLFHRAAKKSKSQVIVTTHSDALLSNNGIDPDTILRIEPQKEGSVIKAPSEIERQKMDAGFPPSQAVLPTVKKSVDQFNLGF